MKAMIYDNYGSPDNLELQDVPMPVAQDDVVLVKMHAASVNWADWHFLTGAPLMARLMAGGLLKPKHRVLGLDLAGIVEAVGKNVTQFRPGDEVFGARRSSGTFAEYVCVSEEEIVPKPVGVEFEAAAATGAAGCVALRGLRDLGRVGPGQQVLINGASGGVGAFAVQIAKSFAANVTGVCSTKNMEMVRSLGADSVIDYTQEDFTRGEQFYDLIFDIAAKRSFAECRRVLAPNGIYVTTAFSPTLVLGSWWTSMHGGKKMAPLLGKPPGKADLVFLRDLLDAGVVEPVIDRCYALSEAPAALRYLVDGHARGKVIIAMTRGVS